MNSGQERVERRLAAILAADVAGYSRLMEADEEGTLAALRAIRRELGDPKIAEHRGRIVKTTGDGMLVEFASVVDAFRCAVELQRAMAERNTDTPPAKRKAASRNGLRKPLGAAPGGKVRLSRHITAAGPRAGKLPLGPLGVLFVY
jgi:class 3 adenylate cyclase